VPDHELVIRITAPTAENGAHWATTIRDLVVAEHGDSMRLAFDGPRVVGPPGADLRTIVAAAMAREAGSKAFREPGREWNHLRSVWLAHADAALAVVEPRIAELHAGAEVADRA
jgi:hypothetical protein